MNALFEGKWSVLWCAASFGRLETVRWLAENGISLPFAIYLQIYVLFVVVCGVLMVLVGFLCLGADLDLGYALESESPLFAAITVRLNLLL